MTHEEKINAIAAGYEINYSTAYQAHTGTSLSPERRAKSAQDDFKVCLVDYLTRIFKPVKCDEQEEVAEILSEKFARKYYHLYRVHLTCRHGLISTMVTGGSNFPVARMEKKNRSIHNKLEDLIYFTTTKLNKYIRIVANTKPAGWSELQEAKDDLETAENSQFNMKRVNKLLRPIMKLEPSSRKCACEVRGLDLKYLVPDVMGDCGYASYRLTNNNSKIKRLKEKVAKLERHEIELKEAGKIGNAEQENEFFKIIDNVEADRVQLIFPGKPEDMVRSWLKSHGFRWSPRYTAWQRKRTNNAMYAVKELVKFMDSKGLV